MKKKYLFVIISCLVLFASAMAQENKVATQEKENFFYIGPVDLFLNTLQLGYEKRLKNHNTLALLGGFTLSKSHNKVIDVGGTAEMQYRVNLLYNKEAISIVSTNYSTFAYFAPYFSYKYEEKMDNGYYESIYQSTDSLTTIHSYFGGFGFGFRLAGIENRFCLNVFLGGGLKYSVVNGLDTYTEFMKAGYTGIAPKMGFQMGIAF